MIDQDVNITGVDLDNSSMWATDKVQQELLEKLSDLYDLSKEQRSGFESAFKDMKETGKVTRDQMKKTKAGSSNIFSDTTGGLKEFAAEISGSGDALTDLASGPVDKFGKSIIKTTQRMGLMGGAVGLIASQFGAAIATIKDTVSAMRDLNSIGITIEGDFEAFQQHLADSGTTIAELANISSQYARTVGNVGIKSITGMAEAAEDGTFKFSNYGLRLAEATEYQTEMLESQRLAGIFRVRDERAMSLALQDNIKRLSAYSKILNVSREEMMKQRLEASSRADVQRMLNSMPEDARIAAKASFDMMTDMFSALGPEAQGVKDMMNTILADPAAVASEEFSQLAQTAPELAQQMLNMRDAVIAGEQIGTEQIIQFGETLNAASSSGQLNMLALNDATRDTANQLGGPFLNSINNFIARTESMRTQGLSEAEIVAEMSKKTNESVKNVTDMQTELDRLAATFKAARVEIFTNLLGPEAASGVGAVTGAIKSLRENIEKYSEINYRGYLEKFVEAIDMYVVEPLRTSITTVIGFFDSMGDTISNMISSVSDVLVGLNNWFHDLTGIGERMQTSVQSNSGTGVMSVPVGTTRTTLSQYQDTSAALGAMRNVRDEAVAAGDTRYVERLDIQIAIMQDLVKEMRRIRSSPNSIMDQG